MVAIENQSDIDHEMPWRIMQYDSLEYERQIREIENGKRRLLARKKKNVSHRETRFGQGDKLHPVYTICFYHGTKPWDGPKSLKDMMDFGADGKLREVMKALYKREDFKNISAETARTIAVMTDNTQILNKLESQTRV